MIRLKLPCYNTVVESGKIVSYTEKTFNNRAQPYRNKLSQDAYKRNAQITRGDKQQMPSTGDKATTFWTA